MNYQKALAKARKNAKATGRTMALVWMDKGAERNRYIVPLAYIDSDEFIAFNGSITNIVHPNGDIE